MKATEPGAGETQVDAQLVGLNLEAGLTHCLGPGNPGLLVLLCDQM